MRRDKKPVGSETEIHEDREVREEIDAHGREDAAAVTSNRRQSLRKKKQPLTRTETPVQTIEDEENLDQVAPVKVPIAFTKAITTGVDLMMYRLPCDIFFACIFRYWPCKVTVIKTFLSLVCLCVSSLIALILRQPFCVEVP